MAEVLAPNTVGLNCCIPRALLQLISHPRSLKQTPHTSCVWTPERKCQTLSTTRAQIVQRYLPKPPTHVSLPTTKQPELRSYLNQTTSDRCNPLNPDLKMRKREEASYTVLPMVIGVRKGKKKNNISNPEFRRIKSNHKVLSNSNSNLLILFIA